ncbi:MAG: DUF3096 domain-containing protein [Pseudomonadota bacterium]
MTVPLEPLLALIGGALILYNEKGLRYVAGGYLLWIAFKGLAPIVRTQLGI